MFVGVSYEKRVNILIMSGMSRSSNCAAGDDIGARPSGMIFVIYLRVDFNKDLHV